MRVTRAITESLSTARALCPRLEGPLPTGVRPYFGLVILIPGGVAGYELDISIASPRLPGTKQAQSWTGPYPPDIATAFLLPLDQAAMHKPIPAGHATGTFTVGADGLSGSIDIRGIPVWPSESLMSISGRWECLTNSPVTPY